ncbi:MAG: hypothetical protein M1831_007121 [Alyxoria varia]|nr:MAG: hypothetical protein M1831_007121 [Alyxoria varia]
MSLRPLDLTTALRPSLLPDETLLFVQDAVGLYAGKSKLADYQNGHAYLTSHRACYVDHEQPRNRSVAVNLKDFERCELFAGFMKSSPKVILIPKAVKLAPSAGNRIQGLPKKPPPSSQPINATWICSICSFSNLVPSNFDPAIANESTPLPPCQACGIKPSLVTVVKAAIASLSNRTTSPDPVNPHGTNNDDRPSFQCPRCTFMNHPSLHTCEMCGTSLTSSRTNQAEQSDSSDVSRSDSPAPINGIQNLDPTSEIKFSFRKSGEKVFIERLRGALTQRKWLLQSAPAPPKTDEASNSPSDDKGRVGIAGLERRGQETRKNNEVVIGNAFEDLAALMASAKEIIALAETFAPHTKITQGGNSEAEDGGSDPSTDPSQLLSQLNLTTTKDMLYSTATSSSTANNTATTANPATATLYHRELSRALAEYLTDDTRGVLRSSGGIASLADVWASFNRARGGVELVSPADFAMAARLFEGLGLPVRLRKFRKSGLLVVQERGRSEEKTTAGIVLWLRSIREEMVREESVRSTVGMMQQSQQQESGLDDLRSRDDDAASALPASALEAGDLSTASALVDVRWGRGVTAQETAERFGWSVGVAAEELEVAEERGAVCRETGLEGERFWENWLVVGEEKLREIWF